MPIRRGRHGRLEYADPGYLPDRQPRYALNTAGRIRDAMGRFTQNAWRYTREQQRAIRERIRRAGARRGIAFAASSGRPRYRGPRTPFGEPVPPEFRGGLLREASRSARRRGRR